jgi:carotenoid cleavage dioxygenase-like enzyme
MSIEKCLSNLSTEYAPHSIPFEGNIPEWLTGSLYRIGPAMFDFETQSVAHWFDGLGMLHRFGFSSTGVTYGNQFIKSDSYTKSVEKGGFAYRGFATDPCRGIFKRFFTMFVDQNSDNTNVNICKMGEKFVAMTETPIPIEFDSDTLDTKGHVQYQDSFKPHISLAHPHLDPVTGDLLNLSIQFGAKNHYFIYRQAKGSLEREIVAKVQIDEPAYQHSFGMSENYFVIVHSPFTVNSLRLLTSGKPFIENFKWHADKPTEFLVIDRTTGELVTRCEGPPLFMFHQINCFEDRYGLHIDLVAYEDSDIVTEFLSLDSLRNMRNLPETMSKAVTRYTLNIESGTTHQQELGPYFMELPRINYSKCHMTPYTYCYGMELAEGKEWYQHIGKLNVRDGSILRFGFENAYAGEPVFIARPGATEEDDGVVASVFVSPDAGRSTLVLLDASTFTQLVVAHVDHVIPFGFHGEYFRDTLH